ncbi:MAG: ABC transporter ATP-binding protein [Lachnospiraceae bacterium]|nr:ABC transporter ATP-binding protein [Lachnospiraceae bacterium]
MNMITAKDLCRDFKLGDGTTFRVLNNIQIEIPEKKLAILRGPSGSGKTTLMNIIGALDMPTAGTVTFDGKNITAMSEAKREQLRRRDIGFIFQSVSLIPIMTAYENVEFALRMGGGKMSKAETKARVTECLSMVGLAGRMNHMPQELSGGEQQRVAIARAIAHRPKVIFADEPTAELDSLTAKAVVQIFKKLVEQEQVTIIMTTHDVGLMDMADVVYMLEDGEIVKNG